MKQLLISSNLQSFYNQPPSSDNNLVNFPDRSNRDELVILRRLTELEELINRELKPRVVVDDFYTVGSNLRRIRDEKLFFAAGFRSFCSYLKNSFASIARSQAYRLIDAASVIDNLVRAKFKILPTSERQCREVKRAGSPREQQQLWTNLVFHYDSFTTKDIIAVRTQVPSNIPETVEVDDEVEVTSTEYRGFGRVVETYDSTVEVETWNRERIQIPKRSLYLVNSDRVRQTVSIDLPVKLLRQLRSFGTSFTNAVENLLNATPTFKSDSRACKSIESDRSKICETEPHILFAQTAEQLLSGIKTVTRRLWNETTAQTFIDYYTKNELVPAFIKSPEQGGKQAAWLRLTKAPFKQKLADMYMEDVRFEGFPELTRHGFWQRFFNSDPTQEVWVVNFEVVQWLR